MIFTLEESTTEKVSPMLDELVTNVLSQSKSCYDSIQKDILFVLIIVLMIENGFSPTKDDTDVIKCSKNINAEQLSNWKTPTGLMETVFVLNGFEGFSVKLIISPLGSMALVNLVIKELDSETYTVCLPVSRYVVSPQASTIPMIFRDLKHFSATFKNNMLTAVKSRILSQCGYPSASLLGIPEEVLYKIILNLPIYGIISMCKTCKRLNFLIDNPCLWHDLFRRDFSTASSLNEPGDDKNWKELYKKEYISREDSSLRQRRRAAGSMHDYMDYSDYVSYIDNPLWDILI